MAIGILFLIAENIPLSDSSLGYNEGVKEARSAKAYGSIAAEAANELLPYGGRRDSTKSDDWNAGFQDGWKAEMGK